MRKKKREKIEKDWEKKFLARWNWDRIFVPQVKFEVLEYVKWLLKANDRKWEKRIERARLEAKIEIEEALVRHYESELAKLRKEEKRIE